MDVVRLNSGRALLCLNMKTTVGKFIRISISLGIKSVLLVKEMERKFISKVRNVTGQVLIQFIENV